MLTASAILVNVFLLLTTALLAVLAFRQLRVATDALDSSIRQFGRSEGAHLAINKIEINNFSVFQPTVATTRVETLVENKGRSTALDVAVDYSLTVLETNSDLRYSPESIKALCGRMTDHGSGSGEVVSSGGTLTLGEATLTDIRFIRAESSKYERNADGSVTLYARLVTCVVYRDEITSRIHHTGRDSLASINFSSQEFEQLLAGPRANPLRRITIAGDNVSVSLGTGILD